MRCPETLISDSLPDEAAQILSLSASANAHGRSGAGPANSSGRTELWAGRRNLWGIDTERKFCSLELVCERVAVKTTQEEPEFSLKPALPVQRNKMWPQQRRASV